MVEPPRTRYARSGDARLAFQVWGEGPPDVVLVGGPASHLDIVWEDPETARAWRRYASFARMITFDRRGTGMSDPVDRPPTLDQQMDDLDAVLDAVGVDRVALIAVGDGGLCATYAATHPKRVSALVLVNIAVSGALVVDDERREQMLDLIENHWGEGRFVQLYAPERAREDPQFAEWWARFERSAVSPSIARRLVDMSVQVDLSGVLPAIRVPTLVLYRNGNPLVPLEAARVVADAIPNARFVEAAGVDLYFWPGADDPEIDLIEEFLTGRRQQRAPDRVLATVLFTDIVGSTARLSELGDRQWREVLASHDALARRQVERYGGRLVDTTGDGLLATFDGPLRGIK